ncbi:hypothetical protein PHLGIDRAFT_24159 [Phlebiopsis gigantea 11061_1 CR5-6]|uniref:Uncharacterized protein n=1 Tax=Phlebiopsis gigantea (strain 11061_1 CR5-6) TaxID=745531 RepID=A0A0C3NPZ8_PHLG1|nr:hypothetical protein PHLGIDRAFT_24159 [Phlebiopsis gigantea 11061_1 CR5-6]
MAPKSFDTKPEASSGRKSYIGVGRLKGNALIPGGDSGIGRAVAILFAGEGADVTIVHHPQEQHDGDDRGSAIQREGREGSSVAFDLENFKNAKEVVDEYLQMFSKLDILINNASMQTMEKDFANIDLDLVESTLRSNILQMFGVTKYALPHLKKGVSVIDTTSVTTFKGSPAMVDYTLTPAEQMEGFGGHSQLGRPGQPSEIAPTYVFLASAEAELYYGQILYPYPLGD